VNALVEGAAPKEGSPQNDPWRANQLVWPVLALLPELVEQPEAQLLKRWLAEHSMGNRLELAHWQLGRAIADAFDDYALYRPDLLAAWWQGKPLDGRGEPLAAAQRWQPLLLAALRDRLGEQPFGLKVQTAIRQLRQGAPTAGTLPSHVRLFGLSSLAPIQVQLLQAMSAHTQIDLYLLTTSPDLWQRCTSRRERLSSAVALQEPFAGDWFMEAPGLEARFGRLGGEFQQLLEGTGESLLGQAQDRDLFFAAATSHPGPGPVPLLAQLQQRLAQGDGAMELKRSEGDSSLEFHPCPGLLRQVQIVRDRILQWLAADPSLEPRDILVMTPQVDAFAPLVASVFGDSEATGVYLPWRLTDRSQQSEAGISRSLLQLLQLAGERLTASSLETLLDSGALQEHFQLSGPEVAQLHGVLQRCGFRWGLDGRERGGDATGSLAWAIDRLLLGLVLPESPGLAPGDTAPLATGHGLELVGRWLHLLTSLRDGLASLRRSRSCGAWAETLAALALTVGEDPLARGVLAGFGRAPRPARLAVEEAPACLWRQLRDDGGAMLCGEVRGTSLWTLRPLTRVWRSEVVGVGGGLSASGVMLWDMNHHLTIVGLDDGGLVRTLALASMSQRPTSGPRHMLSPDRRVWPDDSPEGAQGVCPAGVQAATMSEDGARVALVCRGGVVAVGPPDGPMRALGAPLGERLGATALRFTPDGEALIVGGEGGVVRALDLQTGLERQHVQTSLGAIRRLQISHDGALVAVLGVRGGVGLWSVRSGAWLGELPAPRDIDVALLTDGALVAGDTLTRWSLTGLERPIRVLASAGLSELGLSPDGAALALAQGDGQVRIVDLDDGRSLGVLRAGRGVVKGVVFRPGALWASVMDGAGLVGWSWPSLAALPTPPGSRALRRLTTAASGAPLGVDFGSRLFAWGDLDEEPAVLDVGGPYLDLEPGPGGVITLSALGEARLVPNEGPPRRLAQLDGAFAVALGAEAWAWAGDDGVTVLALDGAWTRALPAPGARPRDLTFSPDGALLAAAGIDGRAWVWSVQDGVLLGLLHRMPRRPH
jgi:WD40 repeat protein